MRGMTIEDPITAEIISAAIAVHRQLGPGLFESAYEACLVHELSLRGVRLQRQVPVPIRYGDVVLEVGYRADLVVEKEVLVEVKAMPRLNPMIDAQVLTYLRFLKLSRGLVLNFDVPLLRDGLRRYVM